MVARLHTISAVLAAVAIAGGGVGFAAYEHNKRVSLEQRLNISEPMETTDYGAEGADGFQDISPAEAAAADLAERQQMYMFKLDHYNECRIAERSSGNFIGCPHPGLYPRK